MNWKWKNIEELALVSEINVNKEIIKILNIMEIKL